MRADHNRGLGGIKGLTADKSSQLTSTPTYRDAPVPLDTGYCYLWQWGQGAVPLHFSHTKQPARNCFTACLKSMHCSGHRSVLWIYTHIVK